MAAKADRWEQHVRGLTPQERLGFALRSWPALNGVIRFLSEKEVEEALRVEEANKRRSNVMKRLKQRLSKIRRDDLMARKI